MYQRALAEDDLWDSVVVGNFGFVLPKISIMVAWHLYFNPGVCNTHWLIWAPPPQQERLPGSEQRAEARRSGSERGHPFHRIAVGWGKRGLPPHPGWFHYRGPPERAQRQVLQARPRQGRDLLIVRCCLQVRAGARAPPVLQAGPSGPQFPKPHPAE